jgi:hypothetical protein
MKMIDKNTVRTFYLRLNHKPYGLTELVAINSNGIVATGFFDDEEAFISACRRYNKACNVYAGRNPRPSVFSSSLNKMDSVLKLRASDSHIITLSAFSLDIDPIRPKDQPATTRQREAAVRFAFLLQRFLGGGVDDSGNGVYIWLPFQTPIQITSHNFNKIKFQCKTWQEKIKTSFEPGKYGLRIDGCFDFSRIKRVIGTFNHKAQRLSSILSEGEPSDNVRDEILSLPINTEPRQKEKPQSVSFSNIPQQLPSCFLRLLKEDRDLRDLWETPNPQNDRSRQDWVVGIRCVEKGISEPKELAVILMNNPYGKYRRDGRRSYVIGTVGKLIEYFQAFS